MKSLDGKSNKTDSPKTPGGISKSLLTPIRRLGLSRKWKKSGTSPFVSPIVGNIVKSDENEGDIRSRKRKLRTDDEIQNLPLSPTTDSKEKDIEISSSPSLVVNADIENTPIRRVTSTRKKSKSLVLSPICSENSDISIIINKQKSNDFSENKKAEATEPKEKCSKTKEKKLPNDVKTEEQSKYTETKKESIETEKENSIVQSKDKSTIEPKVPNLATECIVVIQKKISKPKHNEILSANKDNSISQVLFDSDSDDVPLSSLNKKDLKTNPVNFDFINKKNNVNKKEISKNNISSISKKAGSSKTAEEKTTQIKKETLKVKKDQVCVDLASQKSNYFDDDDDDFEMSRKTILIKRSYEKVIKPSKSKSTGSITQKDIDEIRTRIEMKKKLLIAKSMTKDTEELRGLIKKWQKGCQDALMELLELMRKKIPEQSNMNYSYILEMLKIPPSLVGYNEEDECFNTPDDDNILTAAFNDL